MAHEKLFRLRKLIMYLWVIALPVTFNWMSPVLIVMAGFEGYINLSFIFFAGWFLSSLFVGRAFCSYGCQWGAAQEILGDAVKKTLDSKKKQRNRKVKYGVFVVWMFFVILGPLLLGGYVNGLNMFYPNESTDLTALISFDSSAFGQLFFYFGIIGSVVLLFNLVGGTRSFCNYACPMGVLGIIGTKIKNFLRYPSLHLAIDSEKCINCKQCTKNCVMGIEVNDLVQKGDIYDVNCILCGSCVSQCKNDVISYAWKWKK